MDPITLNLRVGRLPAASAPVGGELSAAELDANFTALKNAAEQLDTEKLSADIASDVTDTKPSPVDADQLVMLDSAAAGNPVLVTKAQLLTALTTVVNSKAPSASPTFTGPVTLPAGQVVNGVTLTTAGGTTNFLRADGTYAAPAGGGATNLSYTAATRVIASDTGTDATLPLVSSGDAGLAPASGGGTSNYLRADGTWAAPAGGGSSALGLWDYWYNMRIGSTATGMPDMFQAAAISTGTNSNSPPFASGLGYNPYGVLLRSSTTADSGFRYTTNNSNDRFGQIGKKFRAQFMWVTAFTDKTVRLGLHNSATTADATNGAYFEVVGAVASCKTAENSVRTTDATTYTLSLTIPYTFDIDVAADGLTKRFRIYSGTSTTAVLDVTISDSRLTGTTYTTGAGVVATMAGTTATDIGVLYSVGLGTIDGFARAMG